MIVLKKKIKELPIWDDIKGIIHFSAHKSVSESVEFPKKYLSNNIGSLKAILNIMKYYKIENLVFSSSCTVYGNPNNYL